jgi:hypothetical protein
MGFSCSNNRDIEEYVLAFLIVADQVLTKWFRAIELDGIVNKRMM